MDSINDKQVVCFINNLPKELFNMILWTAADESVVYMESFQKNCVFVQTNRKNFLNMVCVCSLWKNTLTDVQTMTFRICRADTIFLSILIAAPKKTQKDATVLESYDSSNANKFFEILNAPSIGTIPAVDSGDIDLTGLIQCPVPRTSSKLPAWFPHSEIWPNSACLTEPTEIRTKCQEAAYRWAKYYYLAQNYVNFGKSLFEIPNTFIFEEFQKFRDGLYDIADDSTFNALLPEDQFNLQLSYRLQLLEKMKRDDFILYSPKSLSIWIGKKIIAHLYSHGMIRRPRDFDRIMYVFKMLEPYRFEYKWDSEPQFFKLIRIFSACATVIKKPLNETLNEIWNHVGGWYGEHRSDKEWHNQMKDVYDRLFQGISSDLKTAYRVCLQCPGKRPLNELEFWMEKFSNVQQ